MTAYWLAISAPLLAGCAWAAVVDCRERRIPNWLCVSLLLCGILQAAISAKPVAIAGCFSGIGVMFGIGIVMYLLGAFGGGDVKLLAAVGAWLGWSDGLLVLAGASVVSMLMAMAQSLWHRKGAALLRSTAVLAMQLVYTRSADVTASVQESRGADKVLPFGLAVFVAVLPLVCFRAMTATP